MLAWFVGCVKTIQSNPSLSGVSAIAIALGFHHTCVIVTGGGVKCWGGNWVGQLGIGSTSDQYSPTDVPGVFGKD